MPNDKPQPCPSHTRWRLAGALVVLALLHASVAQAAPWDYVGKDRGVRVWRQEVKGTDISAFRGVKVANVSIGRLLTVFADEKQRKHWVAKWRDDVDLESPSPLERVFWIRFDVPWPVSDRDFVIYTRAVVDPVRRTVTANMKSTRHHKRPPSDCCVRGKLHRTYYKFEALPGGKTRMTVEAHTDPKGSLPDWMINLIQKKWPVKTLNNLTRAAKRPSVKPDPRLAGWHDPRPPPATKEPPPPAAEKAPAR